MNVNLRSTFLNFTKVVNVTALLSLNEKGWGVKGFILEGGQRKLGNISPVVFQNKIDEFYSMSVVKTKNTLRTLTSNSKIFYYKIKPYLQKDSAQGKKKIKLDLKFDAGIPWGHNFCIVEINGKKKVTTQV